MLTLLFFVFLIFYFGNLKRDENGRRYIHLGWDGAAWIFIILVLLHGC